MALILSGVCTRCIPNRIIVSSLMQFRWITRRYRKPLWKPTAKSKAFRIAVHPYVAPEESELVLKLLDEHKRKMESIRKLFQAELDKKSEESILALELAKAEELEHETLMEENRKENERIKQIREETLEKEFQENSMILLEKYEKKLNEEEKKQKKIDVMVFEEEKRSKTYITYESLDKEIELAMDNPINIAFCIDTKGNISWEDTPPKEYEEHLQNCLKISTPGSLFRTGSLRGT